LVFDDDEEEDEQQQQEEEEEEEEDTASAEWETIFSLIVERSSVIINH
jgi:hypothetical protein